jgi:hypothetical protein
VAYVTKFEELVAGRDRGRHSDVVCRWMTVKDGPDTLLQLNTYGSSNRQEHETVSQTMQFDEAGAEQLLALIRKAFPGLANK